jgi:hypothetical protein
MYISESPYAYLSTNEKEAMVEYHQADQGQQQVGITPVVGTQISMTAPLPHHQWPNTMSRLAHSFCLKTCME